MIGGSALTARTISPDTAARLTRFTLCNCEVAVLNGAAGLQLVALWQFATDPEPRITANCFVSPYTATELRAIADHLDAVLARNDGGAA